MIDVHIIAQLRSCRGRPPHQVTIDNFGGGYAPLRNLFVLRPDLVKIDGMFLPLAARSESIESTLRNIVKLATTISPTIVIGGVETESHSRTALNAGIA